MPVWIVLIVSALYMGGLFFIAWQGDKGDESASRFHDNPTRYALALAVYCTSWTYFGAVGTAASSGWEYLPIYVGPIIVFLFLPNMLARIGDLVQRESITSLSDFLAARYGKSRTLAALATLAAVTASLPYISLQLKSVGWSFQALVFDAGSGGRIPPNETVLITSVVLAIFAILFGARTVDTTRTNAGLMRVLAFEAIVKLLALVAVCVLSVFLLVGDGEPLTEMASNPFKSDVSIPSFVTVVIVAMGVIVCLPRQFHVTFIERRRPEELKRARWLFPVYLVLTSLVIIPITLAGLQFVPADVPADLYVLALPLQHGDGLLALFVFLGGFSAAAGMVVVSTVALSTMVTNDLLVPLMMRTGRFDATHLRAGSQLLTTRRLVMFGILALAYGYYRFAGSSNALAQIGLLSFAAAIQFVPALIGALYWRGGRTQGAISGLLVGVALWLYTLFLPEFIGVERLLSVVPDVFHPQAFFGIDMGNNITHGVVWSLGANIFFYIVGSLQAKERLRDRIQAAAFVDFGRDASLPESHHQTSMTTGVTPDGLKALASRFLNSGAVDLAFQKIHEDTGIAVSGDVPADWRLVQRTEKLLASALGSASARVVLTSALAGADVALSDLLSILDQRTQAERFDRHMLQAMLENMPSGISVVDNEQKLVAWNSVYVELFQYPPDLVQVGQPISVMIEHNIESGWLEGDPVEQARRRVEYMRAGSPHRYERQSHDGRWLRITGNPMPGGGYVSIFHDITEDKAREKALVEANENLEARVKERTAELEAMAHDLDQARMDAEGANASKTRFLAAASHDLLQPLNAARLFLASIDTDDNAVAHQLVERADRSIQSADGLLKGLLDISRLDHGSVKAKPETLMLGPLLEDLVDEATPMAEQAGLDLRVAPTALSVRADPDFLQSILRNFLSNARRYTRTGGVLIGARRRGDFARIEVWDTGPGIPAEKQDLLFEEFQRLQDVDNSGVRGAGLGLSVAQRLAGFMGASLDLKSRVGKGSVFSVTVPIAKESQPKRRVQAPPVPSSGDLPPMQVLCVDDERTILDAMSALLEKWGCGVNTVQSLADARRLIDEGLEVDVLLADLELTDGQTGFDVIAMLRSRLPAPENVALLTAKSQPEIEQKTNAMSIELIRKPVDSVLLRRFLQRCGQRLRPQAAE